MTNTVPVYFHLNRYAVLIDLESNANLHRKRLRDRQQHWKSTGELFCSAKGMNRMFKTSRGIRDINYRVRIIELGFRLGDPGSFPMISIN